jgi:predicted DsbA family dithiol-disulfide isomerase
MPLMHTIDIISDVVCPWCYIGKRHLEAALALPAAQALGPVQLRWLPFQLNPDLPDAGISRQQYIEDKFGGAKRAAEIYQRVSKAGQQAGLELNFAGIAQQPNTLRAHALISAAQASYPDIKERLLQAYFIDNLFIGSVDVLVEIAVGLGMPAEEARSIVTDQALLDRIAAEDREIRQMGVSGVPFFIFNNKLSLSGAQPPETILSALLESRA